MAAAWKNNVLSSFGSKTDSRTLEALLQGATPRDSIAIEKDALLAIAQSSHSEDDRRTIMRHIYACLNDVGGADRSGFAQVLRGRDERGWRCVHAGLTIAEYLLQHGSRDLVTETASGYHFDLVQRLSFLEKFEHRHDRRVESMVRRKALSLRSAWLEKQQQLETVGKESEQWPGAIVWHNDDTDDDLSDAESDTLATSAMQSKQPQGDSEWLSDSTNDGESSVSSQHPLHGLSQQCSPKITTSSDLLSSEEVEANTEFLDLLGMQAVNPTSTLHKDVESAGSLLDF
jgi:hypothetical protein